MKKILSILLTTILILSFMNITPNIQKIAYAETITTSDGIVFDTSTGTVITDTSEPTAPNIIKSTLTDTPAPTTTSTVTPVPTPTPTTEPSPTVTPTPTHTATPEPTPTATPEPTSTIITTSDGIVFDTSTGAILDYTGTSTSLEIPGEINGITVEIIGNYSFQYSVIESINIPNTIITIGEKAFYKSNLSSILIPGSVKNIKDYAFAFNYKLNSCVIEEGVEVLGNAVFTSCTSLINVSIPGTINSMGFSTFYCCSKLQSISIGEGLTFLGVRMFYKCENLTTLSLPNTINTIKEDAFAWCTGLELIDLSNVTEIGESVFLNCFSLTEVILSNELTKIKNSTFSSCRSLQRIVLPDSLISIDLAAFFSCTSLQRIVLPDSLISIDLGAFTYCTSLQNIVIPQNVSYLASYVFIQCSSLENIYVDDNNMNYKSIDGVLFSKDGKTLLKYPDNKINQVYNLPESTEIIGVRAFLYNDSIQEIVFSENTRSIQELAFGFSSFENMILPESVQGIGYKAFSASELKSIKIYNPNIGFNKDNVFGGCTNLTIYSELNSTSHYYADKFEINFKPTDFLLGSVFPSNNESKVSQTINPIIRFDEIVNISEGEICLYKSYDDSLIAAIDSSELLQLEFNAGITFSLSTTLDTDTEYYITVPSGMFSNDEGLYFAGLEKGEWSFSTESVSVSDFPKYVSLNYPGLIFKDKALPPQPKGSDSDYARELEYWAQQLGYNSILSDYDYESLLDLEIQYPVEDDDGQIFLMSDESITVQQVMSDIIFISEYQNKSQEVVDSVLENTSLSGRNLSDSYIQLMEYYAEYQDYISKRDGSASGIFMTTMAAVLNECFIEFCLDDSETYKIVKQFPSVFVEDDDFKNNPIYHLLTSDSGQYNTNIQDAVDIANASTSFIEARVSGSGTGDVVVSIASDFAVKYFERSGTETGKAWSKIISTASGIGKGYKLAQSLGNNSIAFPVFIVMKYLDIIKSFLDWEQENMGGWYFYCNYYLAQEYPSIYSTIFDENDLMPITGQFPAEINYDDDQLGWLLLNVYNDGSGGIATGDHWNLIPDTKSRFEIAEAAIFTKTIKEIEVNEMQNALLKYICAIKNEESVSSIGITAECPVRVSVYDENNNLVATIDENGSSEEINEYGAFYSFGDDGDIKYFHLYNDEYTVVMEAYDEGELDITITYYSGSEVSKAVYYENIELRNNLILQTNTVDNSIITVIEDETVTNEINPTVEANQSLYPESACFDFDEIILFLGESYETQISFYPTDCYNQQIEWSSRDAAICSVENGKLTAESVGETEIIVNVLGSGANAECKVTVLDAVPILSVIDFYSEIMNIDSEHEYRIYSNGQIQIYAETEYPDASITIDSMSLTDNILTYSYTGKKEIYIEIATDSGETNSYLIELLSSDFNEDETVDMLDIVSVAQQYNSKETEDEYVYWYDLNFDRVINLFDLIQVANEIS